MVDENDIEEYKIDNTFTSIILIIIILIKQLKNLDTLIFLSLILNFTPLN